MFTPSRIVGATPTPLSGVFMSPQVSSSSKYSASFNENPISTTNDPEVMSVNRDALGIGMGVGITSGMVATAVIILITVGMCVWWKGRRKKLLAVNVAYNRHSGHMTMSVKTSNTEYEYTTYSSVDNSCPTVVNAAYCYHTTNDLLKSTDISKSAKSQDFYDSVPSVCNTESRALEEELLTHNVVYEAVEKEMELTCNDAYGTFEGEVELSANVCYGLHTRGRDEDVTYDYVASNDII